jgi:Fur family peroxide stress response transcriptional regulator
MAIFLSARGLAAYVRMELPARNTFSHVVSSLKSLREKRIELFRKVCKEQGIKVTPQRLEIFLEVMDADDHPSAEDLFRRVRRRMPTITLDTVYRTLSTFDKQGLIAKVHLFEDKTRFDPNTNRHHHLVCTKCRSVMDFYWPAIDAVGLPPEAAGWGKAESKHVQVRGLCSKCLSGPEISDNRGTQRD